MSVRQVGISLLKTSDWALELQGFRRPSLFNTQKKKRNFDYAAKLKEDLVLDLLNIRNENFMLEINETMKVWLGRGEKIHPVTGVCFLPLTN